MKKLIMLAVMVFMTTMIFGQRHHRPDPDVVAAKQADKMKTILSLDDQQYASIKTINRKYASKQKDLRDDSTLSQDVKHERMADLRTQKKAEVEKVLTPDQQTKWNAFRKTQSEKRRSHRTEMQGDRLKAALSLTDDQHAKMQAINRSFVEKRKAIKDNASLSDDAKRAELDKLKLDHDSQIKGILNAEQYQKWQKIKEDRKRRHRGKRK